MEETLHTRTQTDTDTHTQIQIDTTDTKERINTEWSMRFTQSITVKGMFHDYCY